MRFSLGARIFIAFAAVALIAVVTVGILVDRNVRRAAIEQTASRLRYEATMTGQLTASALFAPLARGDASLQEPFRDLGAAVKTHLSLVAPDGAVAADSERATLDPSASKLDAPEVALAIATGRGESIRGAVGSERLWVAEAIRRDGALIAVVRASVPMTVIDSRVKTVRQRLALGAGVAMLVAMASALLLAIGVVRPIRGLAAVARRLGHGELDVRSGIASADELGDLGRALDDMAGNLQELVARLDERNRELRVVLDGVDQGLFTVDADGAISAERSARVDAWFDHPVPGRALWDLFPDLSPSARHAFAIGWSQLAEGFLPVEVVLDQLPTRVEDGERTFELRYLPIGDGSAACRVLVVVTDATARVACELTEAIQRDLLRVIDRALRDKDAVVDFLGDADTLVDRATTESASVHDVQRHIHTLKGNCGLQGIQSVVALCHELEARLVAGERLPTDDERELLRARWSELRRGVEALLGRGVDGITVTPSQYVKALEAAVHDAPAEEIAAELASWSSTPVATSFERLGEHALALAAKLGKEVEVSGDAAGIQLHAGRWGRFWGAMVHAIRNAMDHGLESPEERVARGKDRAGSLVLLARLDRTHFVVELQDDGRGIDWKLLTARLRSRGLPAETMEDLVEGLFADGISTTSTVTEVSGRGVGMSALRAAVRELGGVVEVLSSEAGTSIRCFFPAAYATVGPRWVLDRELARRTAAPGPRREAGKSGARWRAVTSGAPPRARISENFFSSAGGRRF